MPVKHAQGTLQPIIVHQTMARNPEYGGGVSRIVKLVTAADRHIGTIHEIVMPDGSVPHSHPKDYTRRDCSRVGSTLDPQETGSDPPLPA